MHTNKDERAKKTVRLSADHESHLEMLRNRLRLTTDQQVFERMIEEYGNTLDALENMTTRYNKAVREKEDLRMAAAEYFLATERLRKLTV